MGIHPLTLVAGALSGVVLGMALHPAFFTLTVLGVAVWALQFSMFLFG